MTQGRHKETNQFRFRSFNERIQGVRVSAAHRLRSDRAVKLAAEDAESAFVASIVRWMELDLSRPFQMFTRELGIKVDSYALVIVNQDMIFNTLCRHISLKHLEENSRLALPALLEFFVALSTDLASDFNKYFFKTFDRVCDLLKTQDLELLEHIFTCLSRLIKLSQRYLREEIFRTLRSFVELVTKDTRPYIQSFAGDAFAFLLRKHAITPNYNVSFWSRIFNDFQKEDNSSSATWDAFGMLVFQAVRGVQNGLDSRFQSVMKPLLACEDRGSSETIQKSLELIFGHIHRDKAKDLLSLLLSTVMEEERRIEVLTQLVDFKGGVCVYDVEKILLFIKSRHDERSFFGYTELVRALLQSIIPIGNQTRGHLIFYLREALMTDEQGTRIIQILHSIVGKDWFGCAIQYYGASSENSLMTDIAYVGARGSAEQATIIAFFLAYINTRYASCMFEEHQFKIFDSMTTEARRALSDNFLSKKSVDPELSWPALFILSHLGSKIASLANYKEQIRKISDHCKGQLYFVTGFEKTIIVDLEKSPANLSLLRAMKAALFYSQYKFEGIDKEKIEKIVAPNLQHWNYAVRFYSLQILIRICDDTKQLDIFNTLLDAEQEGVSMATYRDRLRFLRKIGTALHAEGIGSQIYSYYLYGSLTINFTLLSQETRKLLSDNLRRQFESDRKSTAEFWLNHMENSMKYITSAPESHEGDYCKDFVDFPDLKAAFCPTREGVKELPDWLNIRDQVWSISESLADFLEPFSKKIMPMFFDFYQEEYVRKLKFQNVLPLVNSSEDKAKVSRQKTKKMLESVLKLFAKFKNPTSLYREPELKAICIELLLHQDFVLQRCAVDYLAAYKKSVAARHHVLLQELCDNGAYRSRFTKLMSSDHEINVVDYDQVVTYALRISFGKMLSQIKEKAGKNSAQVRQKFIVRQIADSAVVHLQNFYDLSTQCLPYLIEANDGSKCWPLGKQIGTLQTIHAIINNVNWGSQEVMESFRVQILKALVQFGNYTAFLLSLENVRPMCKSQLKDIRTLAIKSLLDLSERTKIPYLEDEKEIIFKWIGGLIVNMKQDSIDQVGPTHRLVCAWAGSEYTRDMLLFKLDEFTVLYHLVSLLQCSNVGKPVVASIIKVVSQIFADKEDYWPESLRNAVDRIIPILINYFVPSIENSKSGAMDKETLQLIILISLDIDQPEFCSKLIFIILDQFKSRVQHLKKELLSSIAQLIPKAEDNESDQSLFASKLVGLITTVGDETGVRMELVNCFEALSKKSKSYEGIFKIVRGFNAVRKHLHDPIDFDKRIDTINSLTDEANTLPDFSQNFLYWRCVMVSCLYQFKSVDDMSIQTATNRLIFSIIEKIDSQKDSNFFVQLIKGVVLPEIRRMLKSRNERLRHEYVGIFAKLVVLFSTDPELGQFSGLSNDDPDQDFFQLVTHIQYHKRRHGYKIIVSYINDGHIKGIAASRYVFPIVLSTLLDPKLSGQTAVLEEALDVVGAIARSMPWSTYRRLLDMQLNLALKNSKVSTDQKEPDKKSKRTIMPQRDHEAELKMTVKIICKVLDSVHWPLDKLDDNFIYSVTRFSRESGVTIKHIREFEEIQLQKEKKSDEESDEPMVIDALKSSEGQTIDDHEEEPDEIVNEPEESDNEADDDTMEVDKSTEDKYPIQLLKKVYTHLHLVVRPKLYKLVTRREDVNVDAEADEQVIHIPLASALIKVLCTLGEEAIRSYCPSIILKIVDMLRSRNFSQREIARKALVSALNILGDRWFGLFIEELKAGLQRGYQKHVQIASISALLHGHDYESGAVDEQIPAITETLLSDLVGEQGKEKKIGKIVGKTPEAKGKNYSIGCYKRLAQIVSPGALTSLMQPIKDRILKSTDLKDHLALFSALKAICEGLVSNDAFIGDHLIILSAQILTDNAAEEEKQNESAESKQDQSQKKSCLLLDDNDTVAPKVKAGHKKITNKHYLNQFALSLLISGIKFDKIDLSINSDQLEKLDGILHIIINMLDSNRHSDEAMFIFRLLQRMLKNPRFSTLHDSKQFTKLAEKLFFVLKNQCRGNASNSEYVSAVFKAVTALISSDYGPLSDDYLLVLLGYAEEDLFNNERQATAFPLLHAMLKRNKVCDEMEYISTKVFKLSIQADTEAGRSSARNFFIQFLIDYPLGPTVLDRYINKLLGNTNYGIDTGRESVIASIRHVVSKFPDKMMRPRCSLFFTVLATSFSTDESIKVREDASVVLKELTSKYPSEDYANLTCEYLEHEDPEKVRLGLLLIGFLLEELKGSLQIEVVINAIKNLVTNEEFGSVDDALLVALFDALEGLLENFDLERSYQSAIECFSRAAEQHLSHPHSWVRERAAKLIYQLVKGKTLKELNSDYPEFWDDAKVRSVAISCVLQFKCAFVGREEMEPCKLLVIWILDEFVKKYDQELEEKEGKRSELLWLTQKLNGVAAEENSDRPKETVRRELVIELFIQFIHKHKNERIPHLHVMMEVLAREATAKEDSRQTPEELRKLSHKGATVVEKMVGTVAFAKAWDTARSALSSRREKRGRVKQEMAVTNPEAFNLAKIAKQEKEKARRKRRLQEMKMSGGKKRSKMNTLDKM
ncbi:Oidioi.mRNA.OKI2018_I69.XSR.g15294.t1.cds [Oikopleura dioica]|uniref:Oidioi.mRNA.OKI2018_I69.XSR.g15294.t1.cds n=1 Tax=Oikopleura dioica TaxID=34765 RepID=A0ABN7SE73_OIKDI|nr:Oidioi.mRNA.OKI2018_I69.XSR.g15294.t1.cds [Oikopleura dioica]